MALIENGRSRASRSFGEWLRDARKARNITPGALAKALGVPLSQLSVIELDLHPPSLNWTTLAQQLGMSEHELAVVRQRFGLQDATPSDDAIARAKAEERERLARWHDEQHETELARAEGLRGRERERVLGGAMVHRASAAAFRRKTGE